MPRPKVNDTEQDKFARFERIQKAITALEKQQAIILKQGALAPPGAWVARYQVRQNLKNIGTTNYKLLLLASLERHQINRVNTCI